MASSHRPFGGHLITVSGFSGSGKTTLASLAEMVLMKAGIYAEYKDSSAMIREQMADPTSSIGMELVASGASKNMTGGALASPPLVGRMIAETMESLNKYHGIYLRAFIIPGACRHVDEVAVIEEAAGRFGKLHVVYGFIELGLPDTKARLLKRILQTILNGEELRVDDITYNAVMNRLRNWNNQQNKIKAMIRHGKIAHLSGIDMKNDVFCILSAMTMSPQDQDDVWEKINQILMHDTDVNAVVQNLKPAKADLDRQSMAHQISELSVANSLGVCDQLLHFLGGDQELTLDEDCDYPLHVKQRVDVDARHQQQLGRFGDQPTAMVPA